MSAEAFDPEHFREIILARMEDLDLDNATIGDAGGPSTTKMSSIRRPDPKPPRSDIYRKLDRALRWRPGSAKRVAFGGHPVELPPVYETDILMREIRSSNLSPETKEKLAELVRGEDTLSVASESLRSANRVVKKRKNAKDSSVTG